MAISNPMHGELAYLREKAMRANSWDEHDYYRSKAERLEREMYMDPYRYSYEEQRRVMPMPTPLSMAPDPVTPLTFLKTADKKLLLTGATQ